MIKKIKNVTIAFAMTLTMAMVTTWWHISNITL